MQASEQDTGATPRKYCVMFAGLDCVAMQIILRKTEVLFFKKKVPHMMTDIPKQTKKLGLTKAYN